MTTPATLSATVIESERVVLRKARDTDREGIVEVLSDPEVREYLGGPRHREVVEQYLDHAGTPSTTETVGSFVIAERQTDRFVGFLGLSRRGSDRPGHVAGEGEELELSYVLRRDAWGAGFAFEAAAAALRAAAGELPDQPVLVVTQTANQRSRRLASRLGFQETGVFEEYDAQQTLAVASLGLFLASSPDSGARRYGKFFDGVAAEYDRVRPVYPDELIDRAYRVAGLGDGDPVLEIGCGTGQLTRSLVARGLHVTAVEPGENLIALARQNVGSTGAAEFVNARFEDADCPPDHFRAAFSASALHWVDPDVSWRKIADALVPGGTLALIQYFGLAEEGTKDDQEAILSVLRRIAPDVAADWPAYRDLDATLAGTGERRDNVSAVWAWLGGYDLAREYARPLFTDVQIAAVPVPIEQTADKLNAVTRTMSFYARLSPDQRQALEREITALHQELGRPIRASTVAILVTARRGIDVQAIRPA